jgi:hypothetical protein
VWKEEEEAACDNLGGTRDSQAKLLMMASGTRLRRFAYYGAVVVGTAAALGFTSAHNSSSANPFSRDRRSSGEVSAITDRMSSTGWRVPNRNTQEAALRGSSEVSPFDVLVIGTLSIML